MSQATTLLKIKIHDFFQADGKWVWLSLARSSNNRNVWNSYGSSVNFTNWAPGEPGKHNKVPLNPQSGSPKALDHVSNTTIERKN